jgi:hypothetical protein
LGDRGEQGKRDKTEKDMDEEDVRNMDEGNDDRRQGRLRTKKRVRTPWEGLHGDKKQKLWRQRREEGLGVIKDEIKTE